MQRCYYVLSGELICPAGGHLFHHENGIFWWRLLQAFLCCRFAFFELSIAIWRMVAQLIMPFKHLD